MSARAKAPSTHSTSIKNVCVASARSGPFEVRHKLRLSVSLARSHMQSVCLHVCTCPCVLNSCSFSQASGNPISQSYFSLCLWIMQLCWPCVAWPEVLVFLCVLEIMQLRSSGGSTTAAAPLRAFSRRLFAARRAVQEACALFRPREGMRCPHFTGPAVPVFSFNLKDDNAADFFARRWNVDIRLANAPQEEVAARGVACESLLSSMNGAMHGRRLSLPSWKVITPNRGWCQTRSPHVKVHQSGSRDAAPSRWPNRPVHGEFFASPSTACN